MNFSVELPEEELPLCSCDSERISQKSGLLFRRMPEIILNA